VAGVTAGGMQDDELTAGMSGLLRADAHAARAARNASLPPELRPSASPLAHALESAQRELDAAKAVGDELRADHASRTVDAILDRAREAAGEQTANVAEAMQHAAGARLAPAPVDMNAAIRAASGRR
jgi:hypothetical protein